MADLKELTSKVLGKSGVKALDEDPEKGKAQLKELVNKVVQKNKADEPDTKLAQDDVEGSIMASLGSIPQWMKPEKYRK